MNPARRKCATKDLWPIILLSIASALGQEVRTIRVPGETQEKTLRSLEARKERQLRAAEKNKAFHNFQFSDALTTSGITFRHQVVAEAGKEFKPNHYDHGTAVAAADVDNDGRIDLYFINQLGSSELWRNIGGGKFENITAMAGVAMNDFICAGASFADLDNDGLPDLFVTTVKRGNHLFHNEGSGRFRDVTEGSGISGMNPFLRRGVLRF
jgi:hypothetical protein